jgi:DNA-binding NtrC family response regulator
MKGAMEIKGPQRVLVVDDEPLICWSMAETLASCGDRVIEAKSGKEAIDAVTEAAEPIDVVLLDYSLSDVHDLTLLAALRRVSPTTRIIVMSVYYTAEMAAGALALGASRVVPKPIDIGDLPALVHAAA